VTAFGEQGPDANLAGMDLMMQARSGLMASAGRTRDGLPVATDSPIIDYMCAMTLAFGISSALLRRERTGRGGEVDVSLFHSALSLLNTNMLRVEAVDGPAHRAALHELAQARAAGAPYLDQAALQPNIRASSMSSVYYRTFATKDATVAIACVSPQMQRALMKATGLADESHTQLVARERQPEHYSALQARIEAVMKERTTAEWKAIFDAHGVPNSGVKFPIEMLDDEQVLANGFTTDLEHPALGTVRVLSTPVSLDDGGFAASPFTPGFGTETHQILAALGFSGDEIEALLAAHATTDRPHTQR
jgi:formyl-CoA transferase